MSVIWQSKCLASHKIRLILKLTSYHCRSRTLALGELMFFATLLYSCLRKGWKSFSDSWKLIPGEHWTMLHAVMCSWPNGILNNDDWLVNIDQSKAFASIIRSRQGRIVIRVMVLYQSYCSKAKLCSFIKLWSLSRVMVFIKWNFDI